MPPTHRSASRHLGLLAILTIALLGIWVWTEPQSGLASTRDGLELPDASVAAQPPRSGASTQLADSEFHAAPSPPAQSERFRTDSAAPLRFVIGDPHGEAIENAQVSCVAARELAPIDPGAVATESWGPSVPAVIARSDVLGIARVAGPALGPCPLMEVGAPGYALVRRRLTEAEEAQARTAGGLAVTLYPTTRLEVEVLDAAGRAIAGAAVRGSGNRPQPGPAIRATTNASGLASFLSAPPTCTTLRVTADGFRRSSAHTLPPGWQDKAIHQERIVLEVGPSLHGRVLDANGQPAAGITVLARAMHHDSWRDAEGRPYHWGQPLPEVVLVQSFWSSAAHSAVTGSDGRFTITGLDASRTVHVLAKDGLRSTLGFAVDLSEELVLQLPAANALRLRIVDASRNPLGGASLIGDRVAAPEIPAAIHATTSEAGTVDLPLSSASYWFAARHGLLVGELEVTPEDATPLQTLVLERGAELELLPGVGFERLPVTLRAVLQSPWRETDFRVARRRALDQEPWTAVDPLREPVRGLFPGPAVLALHLPGHEPAWLPLDLEAGKRTRVLVDRALFAPKAIATITVRDRQGRPAPECAVTLLPLEHGREQRFRRTDAAGQIRFERLAAGQWSLGIQSRPNDPELGVRLNEVIQLAPGESQLEFTLPPQAELRVELQSLGGALPAGRLWLRPESADGRRDSGFTIETAPGQSTLTIDGLSPRPLLVSWNAPGISGVRKSSALIPGANLLTLEIPTASLTLRVLSPDQQPLADAWVFAECRPRRFDRPHPACFFDRFLATSTPETGFVAGRTDADGRARLHGLEPGQYWLSAVAPGHQAIGPIALAVPSEGAVEQTMVLPPALELAVRLRRHPPAVAEGRVPPTLRLLLTDAAGTRRSSRLDNSGWFRFAHVAPGPASLELLQAPGGRLHREDLQLPDQVPSFAFELTLPENQ